MATTAKHKKDKTKKKKVAFVTVGTTRFDALVQVRPFRTAPPPPPKKKLPPPPPSTQGHVHAHRSRHLGHPRLYAPGAADWRQSRACASSSRRSRGKGGGGGGGGGGENRRGQPIPFPPPATDRPWAAGQEQGGRRRRKRRRGEGSSGRGVVPVQGLVAARHGGGRLDH